jgi:hypothetical protein
VGVLLVLVLVWGVAIEPRLIAEERHNVTIPGLHRSGRAEGSRICPTSRSACGSTIRAPPLAWSSD